jgi:hypothetical protein
LGGRVLGQDCQSEWLGESCSFEWISGKGVLQLSRLFFYLSPIVHPSSPLRVTVVLQGFVVGADASSQRIIVVFKNEGEEEGKEMALKPDNLTL